VGFDASVLYGVLMRAGDLVGYTGDFGGGRPDDDVGDSTPWQVTVSGAPPRVAVPPSWPCSAVGDLAWA
jgi:hypothetical protein